MATNTEKDMSEHLDKIRADIAALSATVKALASDTAGIQSKIGESLDKRSKQAAAVGGKLAHDAMNMGSEALTAASNQANETLKDIESTVARKPLTALLIALGLGFVLGLFSRR